MLCTAMAIAIPKPTDASDKVATYVASPSGKLWINMASAVRRPILCSAMECGSLVIRAITSGDCRDDLSSSLFLFFFLLRFLPLVSSMTPSDRPISSSVMLSVASEPSESSEPPSSGSWSVMTIGLGGLLVPASIISSLSTASLGEDGAMRRTCVEEAFSSCSNSTARLVLLVVRSTRPSAPTPPSGILRLATMWMIKCTS
mmetsp:Transcript_6149/g.17024  ORF Transcript_6149/g.17024 Transcript_6149/m.17024 type:complete len:201 (+) Transcript_6149:410-1012(+)